MAFPGKPKRLCLQRKGLIGCEAKASSMKLTASRKKGEKEGSVNLKTGNRNYCRTLWEGLKKTDENFSHCRTIPNMTHCNWGPTRKGEPGR